ncbi:MAG TPA: tetratricopeptide repeat protein, partial [Pyrinomonadaceae bacterium]
MKSAFNVNRSRIARLFLLVCSLMFYSLGRAEETPQLTDATRPLTEGLPEVAVVRLRAFLAGRISHEDHQQATERLAEALVASGKFAEALQVLGGPDIRESPAKIFFQAQACAGLSRWKEALDLYQMCAADAGSPFHVDALFGQAESFRALGKTNEALQTLESLRTDERWRRRAEMRSVELLIATGDTAGATRLLNAIQPASAAERNERRFLRGRNEMARGRNGRAIELFTSILKKPEGTTHSVLLATLFAVAEAHRQNGTPTSGDDFLEDFIEHQPRDPELPAIFAKLDQLYAEEKKPARHELGRWSRDPAEPRRALARWYLARAELRLGHRDQARQTFALLRAAHPALPLLAEAFLDFAQLELQDGRFEEAVAILETARKLRPETPVAERIELLSGKTHYEAKRFREAAQIFQNVAGSSSSHAKEALFDASLAWLQAGEETRAAAANQELSRSGSEQARGELLLEQGLVTAGRSEEKAAEILHNFLGD